MRSLKREAPPANQWYMIERAVRGLSKLKTSSENKWFEKSLL